MESVDPLTEPAEHRARISLEWLVLLRWGAVVGQAATIGAAEVMFGHLPLGRLFAYVGILAVTNLVLGMTKRRTASPRLVCGAVLTLDTLLLSGLLQSVGGAYNPFSILYLVHITLAAVVLGRAVDVVPGRAVRGLLRAPLRRPTRRRRRTAPPTCASISRACGSPSWSPRGSPPTSSSSSRRHRARDAEIAEMRGTASRATSGWPRVTTLAAGAAHELGTPLATIAVASQELERTVAALPESDRSRLRRGRAPHPRGAGALPRASSIACPRTRGSRRAKLRSSCACDDVVDDVLDAVPRRAAVADPRLRRGERRPVARCRAPRSCRSIAEPRAERAGRAVDGRRATSASRPPRSGVADRRSSDRGAGMSRDVLARVGEPFFSTKPPGHRPRARGLPRADAGRADGRPAAARVGARARHDRDASSSLRGRPRPIGHAAVTSTVARTPPASSRTTTSSRPRLARAFRERGFEVREAADVRGGASTLARARPAGVRAWSICACRDGSGLEVVRGLERARSGHGDRRADRLRQHRHRPRSRAPRRDALPHQARRRRRRSSPRSRAARRRRRGDAAATAGADVPTLARVEWEHINRVLADCGGNVSQAARLLGIHRRSLQRKLAKYPTPR